MGLQIVKLQHNINYFLCKLHSFFFHFKQNLYVLQRKILQTLVVNRQRINQRQEYLNGSKPKAGEKKKFFSLFLGFLCLGNS